MHLSQSLNVKKYDSNNNNDFKRIHKNSKDNIYIYSMNIRFPQGVLKKRVKKVN